MNALILTAICAAVLLAGCTDSKGNTFGGNVNSTINNADAKLQCMSLCVQRLINNTDLDSGPCLSNKIITDWVCDVAHSPRTAADGDPANQCPEFGSTAHHFVEVDENCNFIQEY